MTKEQALSTLELEGVIAIVTGGAQGIGRSVVEHLAAAGADIGVLDPADANDVRVAVESHGRRFHHGPVSVTDVTDVREAVADIATQLGRPAVLVNVAGVPDRREFSGPGPTLETVDEEMFDKVTSINLKGVIFTTQACFPYLRSGGGSVVNVASVAAFGAGVRAGPTYTATKAGVVGFTRWLARHGGHEGVRANAVAPGPIQTRLTASVDFPVGRQAIRRMGRPNEIAEAVLFLASERSSYVTGQTLIVDGGQLAAGSSILDVAALTFEEPASGPSPSMHVHPPT